MNIDPAVLGQLSGLLGGFVVAAAPAVAIHTHRSQDRLHRMAHEISKQETIYSEFLMDASKSPLGACMSEEIVVRSDERCLIRPVNWMRPSAPAGIVGGVEAVVKAIVEKSLKPGITLRQAAVQALFKRVAFDPDQCGSQPMSCILASYPSEAHA